MSSSSSNRITSTGGGGNSNDPTSEDWSEADIAPRFVLPQNPVSDADLELILGPDDPDYDKRRYETLVNKESKTEDDIEEIKAYEAYLERRGKQSS